MVFRRRQQAGGAGPQRRPGFQLPRFHISPSTKRSLIAAAVVIAFIVIMMVTAPFWINWLWFGSVGYRSVIVTNYLAQVISFLGGGIIAGLIFWVNVRLALKNTRQGQTTEGRVSRYSRTFLRLLSALATVIVALVAAVATSRHWQDIMLAVHSKPFGVKDPTFHRDAGFYVFMLPVFRGIVTALLALLAVTIIAVAVVYAVRLGVRFRAWSHVPMVALRHISGLVSAALLVVAVRYILNTYELVYSSRGVVNGPGFTDVNIVRPVYWLMALVSAIVAIGLLSGVILRNPKWLGGLIGGWVVLAFIITPFLPVIVQKAIVDPNEFRREEKYIERNIQMTRAGFGLDDVRMYDLTGQEQIDPSELSPDQPPLDNVRIWDYRVVQPVYEQIQTFVPFYTFPNVDVDRYTIGGDQTQVLIGVRELDLDGLVANRRTWTNTHLVYTHGYGVVVSPVSEVSADGWPPFIASGIPMQGPPELHLDRPEVYFGESELDWIILHTDQKETTGLVEAGAEGDQGFQGDAYGAIGLGNPFTRALAALTLEDRNVMLSSRLTGDSQLVLERNVLDRARKIAPFLEYDGDPYAVVANGRLYWLIDAYTTSSRFPQATVYDGQNYIRNSVKVVVDAYDGNITFYRTDEADPVADAWGDVYTGLFTPVADAPAEIREHFRYPEIQFTAQAEVWSDYHMDSARTWYDGDDKWTVAEETRDGEVTPMEPFFVSQTLPRESESVFALTVPFTPGGQQTRHNMTAWFAGTADDTGVTTMRVYRYPRQVTVYGPRQIEAQINQDPDISQQITLWGQGGSEVIRGNMLVIPVNDAMLYVQPLYLQATGSSASAPRLARVIVATDEQVVMRPTLPEAIAALADPDADSVDQIEENPDAAVSQAGEAAPSGTPSPGAAPVAPADLAGMSEAQLADEALTTLDNAQKAQQDGDWEAYGREQQRLRHILEILAGNSTPAATPDAGE